jgi:hexosaminidase
MTIPSQTTEEVTLIPEPKTFVLGAGRLNLSTLTQIIFQEPSLAPLAAVLSDEVLRITGHRLSTVQSGSGTTSGIRLVIEPQLGNGLNNAGGTPYFPQRLDITGTEVVASGADYAAVAQATVSLLQLIKSGTDGFYLPISSLTDFSLAQYPGVMLDVARKATTLPELLQVVELCRLYKVRYLHLHLNDNEGFTFQSSVLPNLGTESAGSGPGPIRLSRAQLNTLIQYAENRGVTIVPELETVFHAGTMITSYPEIFGGTGSILNLANDEMYTRGLFPLIEEMCTVFATSPYFHVGGDEADLNQLRRSPTYSTYLQAHGLSDNVQQVYQFHMQRLNEYITRTCNKRVIAWEDTGIPGIITMNWHIGFYGPDLHGDVASHLQAGKSVIQVTWTPSTYTSVYSNFNWSPFDDLTPLGPNNLGSEMVLWELPGSQAVPYLRYKIPPRQERTYGHGSTHRSYEEFSSALAALDAKLDALLAGFSITESGINSGVLHWLISQSTPGPFLTMNPPFGFQKNNNPSVKLGGQGPVSNLTIRYTTDGTNPNSTSNVATTPIPIPTNSSGVTTIKAAQFTPEGNAVVDGIHGYTWQRSYSWMPFSLGFNGLVPATSASTNDGPQSSTGTFRHGTEMQLFLFDSDRPGVVRYSVCGPVTSQSLNLNRGQKLNILGDSTISIGFFIDDSPVPSANWSGTFRQDYISANCIGLQAGDTQTGIRLFTAEECSILGGLFRQNARTWQTQFPTFISNNDAQSYGECLRPDVGSFSGQFRSLNATCPGKTPYLPPNACTFATDTASTGFEPARMLAAQSPAQIAPQTATTFTDLPGVSLSPLLNASPTGTPILDQVEPRKPSYEPARPAIIFPESPGCAEKYCLPADLLFVTSDKGCPDSASQSEQPWAWYLADAKRIDPNIACLMVESLNPKQGTTFNVTLNLAEDQALYCDFWSGKFSITSGSQTFSNLGSGIFEASLCERTQEYLYNYEKKTSEFTDGETTRYLDFLTSTDRRYPFPGIMK